MLVWLFVFRPVSSWRREGVKVRKRRFHGVPEKLIHCSLVSLTHSLFERNHSPVTCSLLPLMPCYVARETLLSTSYEYMEAMRYTVASNLTSARVLMPRAGAVRREVSLDLRRIVLIFL
jgi:hypothetical protein